MNLRLVDEVLHELLSVVKPTTKTEVRNLTKALGCVLTREVVSPVNVPPADNSAMDGYAVCASDISTDTWFEVSQRIAAGSEPGTLKKGTVARIFTGAQIPAGADAVIIQEDAEQDGDHVRFREHAAAGDNVRPLGQDIRSGEVIIAAGSLIDPASLALIASVGIPALEIFSPLKVAILSTGDELVEPGDQPKTGQIFNSNRYVLAGMLHQLGMQVVDIGIVRDTATATEAALLAAAQDADCIISSGGVSVGEEDHVKAAVEKLGQLNLWKLAIKPGKPLAFGHVKGVPFFGLPGNPVSSFVTFHIVARPYLRAMQGIRSPGNKSFFGCADFSFSAGGRREYLRVRLTPKEDGTTSLEKFPAEGSGIMSSVVWADALAEIEIGQTVVPGDLVRFYPLKGV